MKPTSKSPAKGLTVSDPGPGSSLNPASDITYLVGTGNLSQADERDLFARIRIERAADTSAPPPAPPLSPPPPPPVERAGDAQDLELGQLVDAESVSSSDDDCARNSDGIPLLDEQDHNNNDDPEVEELNHADDDVFANVSTFTADIGWPTHVTRKTNWMRVGSWTAHEQARAGFLNARAVATASAMTESEHEQESSETAPDSSMTPISASGLSMSAGIAEAKKLSRAAIVGATGATSRFAFPTAVASTSASTPAPMVPMVSVPAPIQTDQSLSSTQELWIALGLQENELTPVSAAVIPTNNTEDPGPDLEIFDLDTVSVDDGPNASYDPNASYFARVNNTTDSEDEVGNISYTNSTGANQFYTPAYDEYDTCYNCCYYDYTCTSELITYSSSSSDSSSPHRHREQTPLSCPHTCPHECPMSPPPPLFFRHTEAKHPNHHSSHLNLTRPPLANTTSHLLFVCAPETDLDHPSRRTLSLTTTQILMAHRPS